LACLDHVFHVLTKFFAKQRVVPGKRVIDGRKCPAERIQTVLAILL
jgi:hypothetical protein